MSRMAGYQEGWDRCGRCSPMVVVGKLHAAGPWNHLGTGKLQADTWSREMKAASLRSPTSVEGEEREVDP